MSEISSSSSPVVNERAAALYRDHLREIHRRTNRIFVGLLLFQWAAAVMIACWISPHTWIGETSRVHLHVWAALGLGAALVSLPLYFVLRLPDHFATRHLVAIAQALFSALLIHLTGGRIETHFHIFGSLAFLAFYRDWRVLVTASAVVAFDHAIRGVFWPMSVYGEFQIDLWRLLEHVGWVLFEDVFLTLSILQSCREMQGIAQRQAESESSHTRIEQIVAERTAELVRTADQLRQSQKMQAVGTLAGGVAHEFNNMLQVIRGYSEFVLQSFPESDERREDMQQVMLASLRATTLTKQLLGFSRQQVMNPVPCDPNRLVQEACKLFQPLIGEHIELRQSLADETASVLLDVNEFEHLLMNLCVNARDAMPYGGELLIKTAYVTRSESYCRDRRDLVPGRYLELTVADTGCGMTREVRERIFEPFYTTKEVGKGTGLGLAMVYGVVQQLHGTIHVYSEPGAGTSFKVYLPVCDTLEIAEASTKEEPPARGYELILIAEDEPIVRALTVFVLERAGYQTITANNGEEASELFAQRADEVGLVLLDIVMPKVNGHEARRRILERKPDARILFCSGYDPETAQAQRLVKEGSRMIQKPYDPDTLLREVRNLLDAV